MRNRTEQLRESGNQQVPVILPEELVRVIDAEAKRKHLKRGTYLRQVLAQHVESLLKRQYRAGLRVVGE